MPGQKAKSPSQRLRSTLFIYWSRNPKLKDQYSEFDKFYEYKIEEFISYIKTKIKDKK